MNRLPSAAVCGLVLAFSAAALPAAEPSVREVAPRAQRVLLAAKAQPAEFRYPAFPTLLRVGPDEALIAFKVGRSHATDAGAAIEVVRHRLSSGETTSLQRLVAPEPKLYQMGELAQFPDGSIGLHIDVQSVGWDGRHYRAGAETFRWNATAGKFEGPSALGPIDGVLYGYPLDFVSEGRTTWQLIMAFGYHQPGGRWSVDAVRSDDNGRSWRFVRNLTEEFGGIRGNESGFARHGDGFVISTRGYDRIERLHRTDRDFKVVRQTELTGKYPFVNSYVGRPRIFFRDGHGYLIGRNWTRPTASGAVKGPGGGGPSEMQLCLLRFDPETLALTGCVILDNAAHQKVTDGYYAVVTFTGEGDGTLLHVITYKALNGAAPDILRLDYLWRDVK